MHLRVKPFTLFLCVICILFLICGPFLIQSGLKAREPMEFLMPDTPSWTGMITIWDIPYVEQGTGSRVRWLSSKIRSFEKKYPGVFIEVRPMTSERAEMYLSGDAQKDFLPDILSLELYSKVVQDEMLQDMTPFFSEKELTKLHPLARKRVEKNGKLIGVPWMMGGYGLILNQDLALNRGMMISELEDMSYESLDKIVKTTTFEEVVRKKKKLYYGFCSYSDAYSNPLYCMIYQPGGKIQEDLGYRAIARWWNEWHASPANLVSLSSSEAWNLFGEEKRVGILLGSTRMIYRVRSKQESGKGFNMKVYGIPLEGKEGLFMDQIAAYGLLKQQDMEKTKLCAAFLKTLLEDEVQMSLKDLGMFPVIIGLDEIYGDDFEMSVLEKTLGSYQYGPDDSGFTAYERLIRQDLDSLAAE